MRFSTSSTELSTGKTGNISDSHDYFHRIHIKIAKNHPSCPILSDGVALSLQSALLPAISA